MKRYLLDTNIVSILQSKSTDATKILTKLQSLDSSDEIAISIIVLYELVYGIEDIADKNEQLKAKRGLEFVREYLSIIPLDTKEVEIFSSLKVKFKAHTGISQNAIKRHNLDLLIASTAIAIDATLVSHDKIYYTLSEIEPLLKHEDWI